MVSKNLPLDQILQGDCIDILKSFPDESIDLIFADPPYNLQLNQKLWRPNQTLVDGVDDAWDQFPDYAAYDKFSSDWLSECRRVLKEQGAIWVIGSYHNIYRLGGLMQDLGYWFLNDVLWVKTNPMPNFRGVRFTNAHETLIWACKQKNSKYTFNYHAMKNLNDGLQMRSDWLIPLCTGPERIKKDNKKAHSTQKPEALLFRIIVSTSNPGDIILDPFFGTGTTGAVAKKLERHWIGIEQQAEYVKLAQDRLDSIQPQANDPEIFKVMDIKRNQKRVPFGRLIEAGLLAPGQPLFFERDKKRVAIIRADSSLKFNDFIGSIHQTAKHIAGNKPANGWQRWYFLDQKGDLKSIDELRSIYLDRYLTDEEK
ncbi:MAG: site-specific DNA-methyltransferase [Anaerolineales bacterium]